MFKGSKEYFTRIVLVELLNQLYFHKHEEELILTRKCGFKFSTVFTNIPLVHRLLKGDKDIVYDYIDEMSLKKGYNTMEHYFQACGFFSTSVLKLKNMLPPHPPHDFISEDLCWRCHQTDTYYMMSYLEDNIANK